MNRMHGWLNALLIFLLGLLLAGTAQRLSAQSAASPTADQIEMFRNLTPEQQDAILKQLSSGGGLGALGGLGGLGNLGNLGSSSSQSLGQTQQDRQRTTDNTNASDEERRNTEEEQPRIPVLKADDWVIVEIDFHLPPRPQQLYLQSLYGQQSLSPQSLQALQAAGASGSQAAGANAAPSSQETVSLSDDERSRLQALMEMIRSKNPYRLTHDGVLEMPGFPGMPLLGLTEDQATLRLKVEPAFKNIDVRITRLPIKKTGQDALKPFGYDLFERSPSTFAPVTNVPVPSDYVIGPGDELSVQLYGTQNRQLRMTVGRDGRINFPELGPISVAGQLFSSVQSSLESRIERQMIGVRGSVSMGDTRSIRVFVLGEANRPGSYTISGLGTITSALWAAGGVKPIGSLRRIQLKRRGELIRELDLYDLLIRGDTTDDAKLLQGDVIFIPTIGASVAVDGEVRRPAVYEIKHESSVAAVIELAGGLTPTADTSDAMLTRIDSAQRRIVLPVNVGSEEAKRQSVQNGDLIRITRLRPTIDSGVVLEGHVFTPGAFAFHPGMHLTDVIHSVDELRPNADLHYVLIRRELPPDRRVAVLSADIAAALTSPSSKANIELTARDRVIVFDLSAGNRERIIRPILDELRTQATSSNPTELVHVDGRVNVPGEYPLEPGMTVTDLVRAGGGLSDAAYGGKAELTRYRIENGEMRQTQLVDIDLAAAMRGDPKGNITLQPYDFLSVREVPEWQTQQGVSLSGEVRFPGHYAIKRGETLKSVIERAGGLTSFAFPEGSAFTRVELKRREQEQLDMLAERTQHDLIMLALGGAAAGATGTGGGGGAAALTVGQSLIGQLRSSKAVGRLVIDLPTLMKKPVGSPQDVILREGDTLYIPKFQQQVTVIGEVQSSTSHLYGPGLTREDYIAMSGGTTHRADRKRIYVVHANGSVVSSEGNRWFERSDATIKPGDTVVVPLDTERLPPLPFWQAVTGIIYNVAIAAAAVHSF